MAVVLSASMLHGAMRVHGQDPSLSWNFFDVDSAAEAALKTQAEPLAAVVSKRAAMSQVGAAEAWLGRMCREQGR